MKKILFLLLLTVAGYGQTGTGQEQDLDYGMRVPIDTLQTITTPSYLGTFGNTGVIGKIPSAYIEKTADKISAITGYSETSYPNEKATHDALDLKLNISDLPTNLTLYPTNVASDVGGYVKMVTDIHDADYNTVAVDISTPTITGTAQLVSQRISAPGVLIGQPGVFNITTFGNIKRLSGTGTANFYFEVYHRDLAGTETLICTSSVSDVVSLSTYSEFTASGIWDDGDFIATDRIVIKTYANRIAGGTDPVYQFQFGGTQPVRTLLPVPFSVVDAGYEMKTNKSDSYTASSSTTYASTKALVDGLDTKISKTVTNTQTIASTITATSNDSETVGLEVSSAFNNGAFTGVTNNTLKVSGGRFAVGNYSINAKTNLGEKLLIKNEGVLGNTAGSYKYIADFQQANATNINRFQITSYRRGAGSTFQGAGFRLQSAVDNSATDGSAAFIEIGATDPTVLGSGFISLATSGLDRLSIVGTGKVLVNKLTNSGEQFQVNGTSNFSDDLYAPNIISTDAGNIDWQALGDSITYGEGSTGGVTSYANIIQTKVNFKSLVKQAISAITVMPTIGRGELYTQVSAVASGTELITVMAGVNDAIVNNTLGDLPTVLNKTYASLDKSLSFTEAFRYNIEYLKVNFPNAKIIIISPLKTTTAWTTSANLQKYIDAEIAICNYLSVPFIDANNLSGIYPTGTFTPDGLHPNDAGYALLADCVLQGIINPSTVKKVDVSTIVKDEIVNAVYDVAPSQNAVFDALSLKQNTLTNPVTGTGTANYLPKLTGTSTIGNSLFYDNGTYIGLGNSTYNGFKFDVTGSSIFRQTGASSTVYSTITSGSIALGNRAGGGIPMLATRTASTTSNGFTLLAIQNADATRTGEADMLFRTGFETGSDIMQNLTTTGTAFLFTNGTNSLASITRAGALSVVGNISTIAGTTSNHAVVKSQLDLKSDLASPAFTGTPTAPTAAVGTNTTQIATTAFVRANMSNPAGDIVFNQDNGITQAANYFVGKGAAGLYWESTLIQYNGDQSANYANNTLVQKVYADKNRLISYTVATLPASPTQGDSYAVTDALAPAYLTTVAGGGAVYTPVVWNGTAWVAH